MKKRFVILLSSLVFVILAIIIGLFISSKSYYPNWPIDTISKSEAISKLKHSSENIVKIADESGYEWYLTQSGQGRAYDNFKKLMADKGWEFKEQMGAGFIFEKDGKSVIASTQMWSRKYVICQIPKGP